MIVLIQTDRLGRKWHTQTDKQTHKNYAQ